MTKGILTRRFFNGERTLGAFTLLGGGGPAFKCFTCEGPVRGGGDPFLVKEWKIHGATAIPYGSYKVRMTYSPRYKRNMWQLMGVPGFEGVRIHSGNTERDTEGCLLFGLRISPGYGGIQDSRAAVAEFEKIMEGLGCPEWEIEICKCSSPNGAKGYMRTCS